MTLTEIRALIVSDAEASALLEAKNYFACAARCVLLLPKIHVETILTERGLYRELGAMSAEIILQKLAGYADASQEYSLVVGRILAWLEPANEGLDFGASATLSMIGELTIAGVFTTQEQTALFEMSLVYQTITPSHVELAGLL